MELVNKLSNRFLPGRWRILQTKLPRLFQGTWPFPEIFVLRDFKGEVLLYLVGWHPFRVM